MFANILKGRITHYRGDTISTPILIYSGDKLNPEQYTLQQDDKLYFGITEPNQAFETAIVRKVFTYESPRDENGNTILTLNTIDTQYLNGGQYYYSLKLRRSIGDDISSIETLITPTSFYILGNKLEDTDIPVPEGLNLPITYITKDRPSSLDHNDEWLEVLECK